MEGDRRLTPRFDIPLEVELKKTGGAKIAGFTKNISRGGMCVVAPEGELTDTPDIVEIKIKHPTAGRYIDVEGDIRWKQRIGNSWYAGVKFTRIDRGEKSEILEYAYNQWLADLHQKYS